MKATGAFYGILTLVLVFSLLIAEFWTLPVPEGSPRKTAKKKFFLCLNMIMSRHFMVDASTKLEKATKNRELSNSELRKLYVRASTNVI